MRGLGEIFLINPPQSPFFKGGGERLHCIKRLLGLPQALVIAG